MVTTIEKIVLLITAINEGFETRPIISKSLTLDRNNVRFCKGEILHHEGKELATTTKY